jgi:hypothetical protein
MQNSNDVNASSSNTNFDYGQKRPRLESSEDTKNLSEMHESLDNNFSTMHNEDLHNELFYQDLLFHQNEINPYIIKLQDLLNSFVLNDLCYIFNEEIIIKIIT